MNVQNPTNRLPKPWIAFIVLATYFSAVYGRSLLLNLWPEFFQGWPSLVRGSFNYLVFFTLLPIIVTGLLFGFRHLGRELGLSRGFAKGLGLAALLTAPMLIGYALVSGFGWNLSWGEFLYGSVQAGFCEEILFRAFLFGLLYRRAGWGLLPATLIDGLVFGSIHLYQGDGLAEVIGVFLVTGAGGVWFSWLYKEWNFNLWLPIFLHFFMNFSWMAFDMADNAVGGYAANVFRGLTIFFSVWLTVRRSREQKRSRVSAPVLAGGAVPL